MSTIEELQEQIVQLQSRLAFQDDTIEQLNQAITQQQQAMDKLKMQMSFVAKRMKEMNPSLIASMSEETPPPHY